MKKTMASIVGKPLPFGLFIAEYSLDGKKIPITNGKNILTLANGNFLADQKNSPRTTNGCLTRNRLGLCNMTAGE